MSSSYLPILILLGVSVANAVGMLVASHVLNPRRPTPEKEMPYESGMIPLGDTRARFSVKFYMVALSFIIFDLEAVFLNPVGCGGPCTRLGGVRGGGDLHSRAGRRVDLRVAKRSARLGMSEPRTVVPAPAKRGLTGGIFRSGTPTFLTTKVDFVVNWARRNSLWPMPFGTACCAIEMMASAASNQDLARFGMERMAFSPRQADVLICAGRVPYKLAPVLRRVWDQMPQPKWCVSMGACASSGGVFDVYSMVQGSTRSSPWTSTSPAAPRAPRG